MSIKKLCPYCNTKYFTLSDKSCPNCDNIDFKNIDMIYCIDASESYHTQIEEEFDIVMSDFLTQQDGWQHYETQTVERTVYDGEVYTFSITYKNGKTIVRQYHSSSTICQRLINHPGFLDIEKECSKVLNKVSEVFKASDYDEAFYYFDRLKTSYGLTENSTQKDLENATSAEITKLVKANEKEYENSVYLLMLYLLSTSQDGDILIKSDDKNISFTQKTDLGIDAFIILGRNEKITNKLISKFDKLRKERNYRKAVLLTTCENKASLADENIIIYDIRKLFGAYITAFKKIISESGNNI